MTVCLPRGGWDRGLYSGCVFLTTPPINDVALWEKTQETTECDVWLARSSRHSVKHTLNKQKHRYKLFYCTKISIFASRLTGCYKHPWTVSNITFSPFSSTSAPPPRCPVYVIIGSFLTQNGLKLLKTASWFVRIYTLQVRRNSV